MGYLASLTKQVAVLNDVSPRPNLSYPDDPPKNPPRPITRFGTDPTDYFNDFWRLFFGAADGQVWDHPWTP